MRPCFITCGLGLILPVYGQFTLKPCLTTETLPFITVSDTHDGFQNEYTRIYQEFYSEGLREKTYIITQTCSDIDCQPPPIETAPPPGFTQAVVKCSDCGGPGLQAATLTFPTQSIEAYSSSGFVVVPISSARPTQALVDQDRDQSYQTPSNNGDSSPSAIALSGTDQESYSTDDSKSHAGDSSDQSGSGSRILGGLDIQNKQHGQNESDSSASQQSGSDGGSEKQQSDNGSSKSDSKQPGSNDRESAQGGGSSNEQAANGLGNTNSEKQWNSTETVKGSGSVLEKPTPVDESGSSSSSTQDDFHGSPNGALDTPGASNEASSSYRDETAPSDAASTEGEYSDTNSNHTTDASSSGDHSSGTSSTSDDTSGASDHTFDSSGDNTPGSYTPGSTGNGSSSSQKNSPSKETGVHGNSGEDSDAPDVPAIVSSANSTKTNVLACIMATMASIFITRLSALV